MRGKWVGVMGGVAAVVLGAVTGWSGMARFPVGVGDAPPVAERAAGTRSAEEPVPIPVPPVSATPANATPADAGVANATPAKTGGSLMPTAPPPAGPSANASGSAPQPAPAAAPKPAPAPAAPSPVAPPTNPAPSTPAASAPSVRQPPAPAPSAQALYDAAMAAYRARRHAEAREMWQRLLQRYPSSALVPNARYWIGETWYAQGRLLQAIWAWETVLHFHPRHPKAADALFKIALARQRLGEMDLARRLWRQVVAQYPGTNAAWLAQQHLGEAR